MKKYNKPLSKEDKELLDKLSSKNFANFSETDIREEFLTPLLTLLGYEKNTDYEVEREEGFSFKGVLIPFSKMYLKIGTGEKKLDYICNVRKDLGTVYLIILRAWFLRIYRSIVKYAVPRSYSFIEMLRDAPP